MRNQRWRVIEEKHWLIIEWTESGHTECFRKDNWHAARAILDCSTQQLAEALFIVDPKLWLTRQSQRTSK